MVGNIFIGILVSGKLQEALDGADATTERYFKCNDPDQLQMTTSSSKNVIGKRLGEIVNIESVENIVSNIISILKIICPNQSFSKSQFKIFTQISIG